LSTPEDEAALSAISIEEFDRKTVEACNVLGVTPEEFLVIKSGDEQPVHAALRRLAG
jgi:hypothetical protein